MSEDDFSIGVPGLEPPQPQGMSFLLGFAHVLMFLGGFVLALIIAPNFLRAHSSGELTSCKSNCKNIATGLEMYASDNKGLFPDSLARLTEGNYLKVIPTCPAAGKLTYTDYTVSPKRANFHFSCVGNNHARAYIGFNKSSEDLPAYSAAKGLVEHP